MYTDMCVSHLCMFLALFTFVCLFCPIHYYFLNACFLMRVITGVDLDGRGSADLGSIGGVETIIRICFMDKNIFNKRKIE